MKLNTNLHNPVPLHTSKNLWYCNARHAESMVDYFPVLPLNSVPRFQLTSPDYPVTLQRSATLQITLITNNGSMLQLKTYTGTVSGGLTDDGICTLNGNIQNVYSQIALRASVTIRQVDTDAYTVSTSYGTIGTLITTLLGQQFIATEFTKAQIEAGLSGNYEMYQARMLSGYLTTLGAISMTYSGSNTVNYTINVCKYSDDSVVATITNSAKFTLVEPEFLSDNIKSFVAIGGDSINSHNTAVGPHYIELIIGAYTWYSEPFVWSDNLYDYVHVRYRRTKPIITADNYIAFVDQQGDDIYADMYLPTALLAPPYTFESEVEEVDGYKFVQKLVSYRSEKLEFFCTGYFAEALRILWHCNVRLISQQPEAEHIVDFMDSPEISWDNDTHYCSATITFNADTIMQTNGNVEADLSNIITQHQSFDSSFDSSFN